MELAVNSALNIVFIIYAKNWCRYFSK